MPDPVTIDHTNDPITPGLLLDQALAGSDLPPRDGTLMSVYLEQFASDELRRRLSEAWRGACQANIHETRHWIRQAEMIFVSPGGDRRRDALPSFDQP